MDSVNNTDYSVGCPIRTCADQRLLSPPRTFSQSATSFFASNCQGIHQMPFLSFSMRMWNLIFKVWHTGYVAYHILAYYVLFFNQLYLLLFIKNKLVKLWTFELFLILAFLVRVLKKTLYIFRYTRYTFLFTISHNFLLFAKTGSFSCICAPLLVEVNGIEPMTYALQTRRSPSWAIPPAYYGGPGKTWTSDLTLIRRAL